MKRAAAALCVAMAGCPKPAPAPPPTTTPAPEPAPPRCESEGDELGDLAFLPADAAVVAVIDAQDDGVGEAVGKLSEFAKRDGHGLPINVAFSIAQWAWEVPVTVQTLRRGGIAPGELAFVLTADGTPVWIAGHHCDTDQLGEQLGQEFGLSFRASTDALVGTSEGDAFPIDIVLLPGDRLAYCPGGTGAKILRALTQSTVVDPAAPPSAVKTLQGMEPSVVRVALAGPGLTGDSGGEALRRIRVTADGIELDGALRR